MRIGTICTILKKPKTPWVFSRFLNCSTGSKSRNVSHIVMKHFPTSGKKIYIDAHIYTEEHFTWSVLEYFAPYVMSMQSQYKDSYFEPSECLHCCFKMAFGNKFNHGCTKKEYRKLDFPYSSFTNGPKTI